MINPYPFQQKAVNSIFKYFYDGNRGNPLVVAPTGSGKSIIISTFCKTVNERWPKQKILIVSHTKEILKQDYDAIKKHLKITPGLYSSGLKKKIIKKITVAGIQSIYNKPELFDLFDIVIVDECHLIPHAPISMYRQFFNQVKKPVIGFTATPFRLGKGYLHLGKDAYFDDIVYNIPIKKLQEEGYLCKLTCKGTAEKLDTKGVPKQRGDYILKELSLAFDRELITKNIIQELLQYKKLRKKWLVFAIDINHAENITAELNANDIKTKCVHSKMKGNRDEVIDDFKTGKFQTLVSVSVLTVGFDAPDVDLIALIRPTESVVLHIQIIGRGLRTTDGKDDCLILDFAGNLMRNGPIDAPVIRLKGDGVGEAIMKECDKCFELVYAAVRICPECGYEFKFRHHLSQHASDEAPLTVDEWHPVDEVEYMRHVGKRDIPMLKITYHCGVRSFNEFMCIEHSGYAQQKARRFWERRSRLPIPKTAQEAYENSDSLRIPQKIYVSENGAGYPDIKEHKF